ncbi:hypothetical protein BC567DRAFT_219214 [Phyllosticta citribraziliensis]
MVERPISGAGGERTDLLGHASRARHARLSSFVSWWSRRHGPASCVFSATGATSKRKSVVGRSVKRRHLTDGRGVIPSCRGLPNQDDAGAGWAVAGVGTCFPRVEELEIPEHHRHPSLPSISRVTFLSIPPTLLPHPCALFSTLHLFFPF